MDVNATNSDEKYYQSIEPGGIREILMICARDKIYEDFILHCRPSFNSSILDVGVSNVINDGANVLEQRYPYKSRITAAGLGDAREFKSAFPEIKYVQIAGGHALPFADGAFDIATSNAVLEHVGSLENQRSFLRELLRVGKKIFVTVPNRFFPVEHHTAIPLLHYFDRTFAIACSAAGKREWAELNNLILMSRGLLSRTLPREVSARIAYTGLKLGPWSSNLLMFIQ